MAAERRRRAGVGPADVREWRARWSAGRLEEVNRVLTRFWRQAGSMRRQPLDLGPLGLEVVDGRADLRGVTLSHPLACFEVTDADFGGLAFGAGGQLGPYARFVGCRFDRMEKPGNVREEFERCSFDHANLHRAVLGRSFVECSLRSANLRASLANGGVFRGCAFDGADLRHVQWTGVRFERCTFAGCRFDRGSLAGSTLVGCEIDRAALAAADVLLERVEFGDGR